MDRRGGESSITFRAANCRRNRKSGRSEDPPRWLMIVFVAGVLAGALLNRDAEAAFGLAVQMHSHSQSDSQSQSESNLRAQSQGDSIDSTRTREQAAATADSTQQRDSARASSHWAIPSTPRDQRQAGRLDVIIIARGVASPPPDSNADARSARPAARGDDLMFERQAYGAWLGDTGYAVCAFHQIRGITDPLFAGESAVSPSETAAGEGSVSAPGSESTSGSPTRLYLVYADPMRDLALLSDSRSPADPASLRSVRLAAPSRVGDLVASYPGPRPPTSGTARRGSIREVSASASAEGGGASTRSSEGDAAAPDGTAEGQRAPDWTPDYGMVSVAPPVPRGTIGIIWTTDLSNAGMSGSPVYDVAGNLPFGLVSAAGWQRNGIAPLAPFLDNATAVLTPDLQAWPLAAVFADDDGAMGDPAGRGDDDNRGGSIDAAISVLGFDPQRVSASGDRADDAAIALYRTAASAGMLNVVNHLLETRAAVRANVDIRHPKTGATPLMLAVSPAGDAAVVDRLLRAGANANLDDALQRTALHHAVASGQMQMVDMLLAWQQWDTARRSQGSGEQRRGRPLLLNRGDRDGITSLMIAARAADARMIDRLLAAGADVQRTDRYGRSALHHVTLAFRPGAAVAGRLLRPTDAERDVRSPQGQHSSASNPQRAGQSGFVNHQDRAGDTALSLAARLGKEDLVAVLLDAGAAPNIANRIGATPMHQAAETATSLATLEHLLIAGGDPNQRTRDGRSAFDMLIAANPSLIEPLLTALAARPTRSERASTDGDASGSAGRPGSF